MWGGAACVCTVQHACVAGRHCYGFLCPRMCTWAPPRESGGMHPVGIHLGAQVGRSAHACVCARALGYVCTLMDLTVHAPTRKLHLGKRHGARATGGWQIRRAKRTEEGRQERRGRSQSSEKVELGQTVAIPEAQDVLQRRHRCAHTHTGGHTYTRKHALTARESNCRIPGPAPMTSAAGS